MAWPRLYYGIPAPHYPFHDRTVVVTSCGRLCLYRKKINLSVTLAGQAVGIKEVDTGIWLVSFMEYGLGYIDLEEKTLQPLENPFGPKVLPNVLGTIGSSSRSVSGRLSAAPGGQRSRAGGLHGSGR